MAASAASPSVSHIRRARRKKRGIDVSGGFGRQTTACENRVQALRNRDGAPPARYAQRAKRLIQVKGGFGWAPSGSRRGAIKAPFVTDGVAGCSPAKVRKNTVRQYDRK